MRRDTNQHLKARGCDSHHSLGAAVALAWAGIDGRASPGKLERRPAMSTTRSSLFASIAIAALAVTGTGLIASAAAASPFCHRLFGGGGFGGGAGYSPRHASVAPSY